MKLIFLVTSLLVICSCSQSINNVGNDADQSLSKDELPHRCMCEAPWIKRQKN